MPSKLIGTIRPLGLMLLVLLLSVGMQGCAGVKIVRVPIPVPTFGFGGGEKKEPPREIISDTKEVAGASYRTVGYASWYGPNFHGKQTANGERFNQNAMTAAHPTLPFGTRVRVTNLENGRRVIVRINDRGPFKDKSRIIDLSRAAAERLDFIRQGLTRVRLEVI